MADEPAAPTPPRAFWKGYLKLSLVTCRVALVTAKSESEKIRFHTINRKTGNRIRSRYVDAVTGARVDEADEVKGYPVSDTKDIMLVDDEIESVALDSTRTIDIETFVPESSITPIWYDTPHYLVPDDDIGTEAYSVIREAMASSKSVGIARLVLYRRERAILLKPFGKGFVLWTLRFGDEVRNADDYFGALKPVGIDSELTDLMADLIRQRTRHWSDDLVADPVQAKLLDLIGSKRKAQKAKPKREAAPAASGNVIDLKEALKRSLAGRRR